MCVFWIAASLCVSATSLASACVPFEKRELCATFTWDETALAAHVNATVNGEYAVGGTLNLQEPELCSSYLWVSVCAGLEHFQVQDSRPSGCPWVRIKGMGWTLVEKKFPCVGIEDNKEEF
jgi:hypothetical protein